MEDDYYALNSNGVMSVLGAFAVQSHELFVELKSAGFNEEQAIKILIGLATTE